MGGRGGSSGISADQGKIKAIVIDYGNGRMSSFRLHPNGLVTDIDDFAEQKNTNKLTQLQRKRQDLERKRSLYMQKNESQESNTARRPFVNSYGEATKREITSLSYNRSMNSTKNNVENFLGIKKKKKRRR